MSTQLHRIDGYALCALLRKDPITSSATIIVVTADALPADTQRAMRAGADEVLVKPCTPEHMIAAVHRAWPRPAPGEPPAESSDPESARKRGFRRKSRSFARRSTITPPAQPPLLRCPRCDSALTYKRSHIGGVSGTHAEQWDYYDCSTCGVFQYRQRTRKLTESRDR